MKVKFFLINFVFLLANISISFAKIQWTTLSPEQAFLKAKQEGKYLFVYWGAVWCPPCNQIKKNIFTNPLFQQELNEHFLSLYLDGDQPEAQTWGDKLRSSGYPTLLILSPEAKEILRLPLNASASKMVDYLQLARTKTHADLKMIVENIMNNNEAKKSSDWTILGNFDWAYTTDPRAQFFTSKSLEEKISFIQELISLAPESAKNQLRLSLFQLLLVQSSWSSELSRINDQLLKELFTDEHYSLELISNYAVSFHSKMKEEKNEKILLLWLEKSKKFSQENYDWPTRLSAFLSLYLSEQRLNLKVNKNEIISHIEKALAFKTNEYETHLIKDASFYLLSTIGEEEKLLLYMKNEEQNPLRFYYYSTVASFYEKKEDWSDAKAWRLKAWQNSTGAASRFQWGVAYLSTALKDPNITADTSKNLTEFLNNLEQLLLEHLQAKDFFAGRNLKRWQNLKALLKSSQDYEKMKSQLISSKALTLCEKVHDKKICETELVL